MWFARSAQLRRTVRRHARLPVTAVTVLTAIVSTASAASLGWSTQAAVDPLGRMTAVSCASGSFCVAVDSRFAATGYVLTFDGSKWSAPLLIDPTGGFNDVSCPTTSFCAAVTSDGRVYTYDGSTWSAPTLLGSGDVLSAVSCASSAFCVATGSDGNRGDVFTYDGTAWSGPAQPDTPNVIDEVSCPTSSFCAAADDAGNVLTFNGASWSDPEAIGGANAVSCPTSSFCMAIGDTDSLTYDDGVWTQPVSALPGGGLLEDVSCSSSSFCVAVTQGDQALIYDGSGWSSADRIILAGDGSTQLSSVSCAGSFCAAVDRAGNAVVYPVPVTPSPSQPIQTPQPLSSALAAPSDFRAAKITATSITLSWKAPKRGRRPAGYEIAELAPAHHGYIRIAHLRTSRREFTVRRLRPRTRYRFRIESVSATGTVGRGTTGHWITTRPA